jgi:hypothetical protein
MEELPKSFQGLRLGCRDELPSGIDPEREIESMLVT